jgi:protein SCO1/2
MEFQKRSFCPPLAVLASLAFCLVVGSDGRAQEKAGDPAVGLEPRMGETIPLDLTFSDEEGSPVTLRSLVRRPTVLVLVYFRCPNICSPLMHELAKTVDNLDLEAGADYDLITVSFDPEEGHELARNAKKNLLGGMKTKIPPDSWRFLTGDDENISRLVASVGFHIKKEKQDYNHPTAIIFLSEKGKIVRYLPGLSILPAHVKMAILDAAEGRARSFMQQIARLCYSYDPEGKTYVFKINRLVLGVTVVALGIFLIYLLAFRRKGKTVRAGDS